MYILPLVDDVRRVAEHFRQEKGEFSLAMLYNDSLEAATGWNLIISAPWADELGRAAAIRSIAQRLHDELSPDHRTLISRVTVLKINDPFVRQIGALYAYPRQGLGGVPIANLTAADREGAGFLFYANAKAA